MLPNLDFTWICKHSPKCIALYGGLRIKFLLVILKITKSVKKNFPSKYSGCTVPFSTGDDLESDHYIVVVHLGKTYVSVDTCTALLTIKAAATVGTSTLTFMQLASPFVLQATSKVASKPLCAACCNKHMFMYVD